MSQCRVEVVASTVEDVLAAAQGGADRVEFCVHLDSGGLTPGRSLSRAAFDVAKEFALHQFCWNSAAVNGNKRGIAMGSLVVD